MSYNNSDKLNIFSKNSTATIPSTGRVISIIFATKPFGIIPHGAIQPGHSQCIFYGYNLKVDFFFEDFIIWYYEILNVELNKVGLKDFYSRRGAPEVLRSGSKAQERRAKEKADNRANAFDYRNIKFGSNACIIVSDIIKKDVKENILDKMMCGLCTYLLFDLISSIFLISKWHQRFGEVDLSYLLSNVCAVTFFDLKTSFLHHQAAFTS